ncbi:hypothetical protein SAMN04488136_1032 [Vibrio xiamenensis]|uniref:Uncharacterized protein n=2 Tax=Vibrio xiamenensis TaxID=861298 RepID=A0A1G7X7X1_9VIBR|nr:hypothetical protein [Vibrio xiamenensis]SDG80266.1 hypothetical protein SAMN04488136_1032 [Vibrio xiamenensis]
MVVFGETNTDGTGSAANLSETNGESIGLLDWQFDSIAYFLHDNFVYEGENIYASIQNVDLTFALDVTNNAEWNQTGLKEVSVTDGQLQNDGEFSQINISGFVDVHIDSSDMIEWLPDYEVLDISVYEAKRGAIDVTGVTNDVHIEITPYSNGEGWSNTFSVATGEGDDHISFDAFINPNRLAASTSRWTEFDVNLGSGDDTFYYALTDAELAGAKRLVEGGEGFDTLTLSTDTDDLSFSDFELVTCTSNSGVSLSVDSDLLAENASELGFILDDVSAQFSDDYTSIEVADLSQAQSNYLSEHDLDSSEFAAVTVTYGDESYTLLTNEVSDAWS